MFQQENLKKYLIVLSVLVLLLAGTLAYVLIRSGGKGDVVARVDGQPVSKDELYELMVQSNGQAALDSLISQKLVELEAKEQNITATDAEVQKELDEVAEYYGGLDVFEQSLKTYNLTLEDVKEDLAVQVKLEKLMKLKINVTDKEIQEYFTANKELYDVEEQVKASHILVDTEEKAQEIRQKLEAGGDFAELAKTNSQDTTNKDQGGDLGTISRGQMVEEFEEAAFSLPVGEISQPVKTEYGYHIIKVTEKIPAREGTLAENKEGIRDTLFNQKMQTEYSAWLDEQYKKHKVETLL
ncbi:MAG TPA: peptidylprolyl isomerase [Syntrophomonadaceae bacterium]|jgi:foldase protein PrsA|nr:peptidylprolyl isomerase [Syntrophomonadaceae bacterium]HRX21382.1 peptidylprolyl isomerase [Syntrophomonadaceae bacterium]